MECSIRCYYHKLDGEMMHDLPAEIASVGRPEAGGTCRGQGPKIDVIIISLYLQYRRRSNGKKGI